MPQSALHRGGDILSKASNAVLALSRAYYGKRLTGKQYADLLSCKNINEIASYLRSRTVYSEAFEGAPTSDFTAKGLESFIERYKYDKYNSICRYERAIGNEFYKYFTVKTETEQILRCTLLMLGGNTQGYLMDMSAFLDMHLTIDLYALGRANSLEEIADALKKTPYEKIFRKCLSDPEKSYLTFELAFDDYFRKYQDELVNKCFGGKEKSGMYEAISRTFDMQYIEKQLRIADYYSGLLAVSNLILPYSSALSLFNKGQIKQLTKASTKQEILDVLSKSPYKSCAKYEDSAKIQDEMYLNFYRFCKKQIRFSSYPGVVMYCYLFLSQNETRNIIRIIEGVRYGLSPDEIKESLIGIGD